MNKYLLLHRICKLLRFSFYYENSYGIKEFNKHAFKLKNKYSTEIYMKPDNILLGFDGLKDSYTLLGTPICHSPHYQLLKLLNENKKIDKCDYVKRENNGTLDGRNKLFVNNHEQKFEEMKRKVKDENYNPVLIYMVDNNYYVFDGKHRLAMCSLYGMECKCVCIDLIELIEDIHTRRLYEKMKRKKEYSKNIEFLNKILMRKD